jgi:hypothetical protein
MPRKVYDESVKAAFMKAAADARAEKQPWAEVFKAAAAAGYTGTLQGIKRMLRPAKPTKAGRKTTAKRATPAAPMEAAASEATRPTPTKRGPKAKLKAGRRKRAGRLYDATTRAAILKAATSARAAGKTWRKALDAATSAGYRGGVVSLMLFVRAAAKSARKRGRPAGKAVSVGKATKAKRAAPAEGLESVQQIIDGIVNNRVQAALDKAIAALKQLR